MLALLIRMPAMRQAKAVIMRIVYMVLAWFVGLESVTRAQPVPSEGQTRVGFTVGAANRLRRPRVDQRPALFAPLCPGAPLLSR
jgi:hypothetical protein